MADDKDRKQGGTMGQGTPGGTGRQDDPSRKPGQGTPGSGGGRQDDPAPKQGQGTGGTGRQDRKQQ